MTTGFAQREREEVGGQIIRVRQELARPDFQKAIAEAMPKGGDKERMIRGAITAMTMNPDIYTCEPKSIQLSMIQAAQFGFDLAPGMGEAYLIPFNDTRKRVKLCQMVPGYKGLIKLALNHPKVMSVRPVKVYKNDKFHYTEGLNPTIDHVPAEGDRGPCIKFYCVVKMQGGEPVFQVWTKEQCLAHGKIHSKTFNSNSSPWKDPKGEDGMCLKTVVRATLNFVPKSASDPLAQALASDPDDSTLDVKGVPIFDLGGSAEYDGDEGDDRGEGLPEGNIPLNREFLLHRADELIKAIPANKRSGINLPQNLNELNDRELDELAKALEAKL